MQYIRSLAVEPQSVETPTWRSTRYKHWIEGFIVDGDYYLILINKRTFMRYTEHVWHELTPPFPVPEGEGLPTLVNPDDPFYIWSKKPELWHPCWFQWKKQRLTIVDMVTGEIIGRGVEPTFNAEIVSGDHEGKDEWRYERGLAVDCFARLGYVIKELVLPSKNEVIEEVKRATIWTNFAHGTSSFMQLNSTRAEFLSAEDVGRTLIGQGPLPFSFIGSCGGLDSVDRDSWAREFTKNTRGCVAIGATHMDDAPEGTWQFFVSSWCPCFFNYLGAGYRPIDVYEFATARTPQVAGYVAYFEGESNTPEDYQETYTLEMEVFPPEGGYTDPAVGVYTYEKGTVIEFAAYPSPGYEFEGWYINVGEGPEKYLDPSGEVTIETDTKLSALFKAVEEVEQYTFTFAVSPSGSGYTDPSIGTHTYDYDTTVIATAYPNPGYEFDYWLAEIGDPVYMNPIQIMVWADHVFTAHFKAAAKPTYTLSTSVTPSGSGTVSPSSGTYDEGSIVTLTATPLSGYKFSYWSGAASGTSRTVNVVMNMDRHVVANFVREEIPVTPDWLSMVAPLLVLSLMMGIVSMTTPMLKAGTK